MAERLTAAQGTQPRFGEVRVGVMRAGIRDGVPTTRLSVRTPDESHIVDVAEGDSVDVPGHGVLTVVGVHPRLHEGDREAVSLEWEVSSRR